MKHTRVVLLAALVLLSLAFADAAFARKKTDVVYLTNGDRITGEIKHLMRGILSLGTDDIGTLNIEWEDVDSLYSVYEFRVEEADGAKSFGVIALLRAGNLRVNNPDMIREAAQENVIGITPLEASFWEQLDGAISLGFSYTKSNSLGQLTGDINVSRRTRIRTWSLDASAIRTSQEDEDTQSRSDISLIYLRLFEGRPFILGNTMLQSNDELGLDLRLSFAAGPGLSLVQSDHNEFYVAAGLSVNREWSDVATDEYNLEAFLGVEHSVFRYDFPKTKINSEIVVYPSLTSAGRLRGEVDISVSREIVSDFTFVLSFYDSYDSDPLDAAAQKNDYGVVTSLGWTF